MRDEESRLSSDTLHWYSACITHHRQPIVTGCSVRSHEMIEAEKWLTGSLRRNQRLIYGRLLLGSRGVRAVILGVCEFWEEGRLDEHLENYCCIKFQMIKKKNHGCFPAPVHQSAVFCKCETSSSVSYEEKPPLWAFIVRSGRRDPFWVLFPTSPSAVCLIDMLQHLRLTEQSGEEVLQLNVC